MLMQHVGVGYFGYYRATAYAMKNTPLCPRLRKLRMKALNFWDKHGIRAAADALAYQHERSTGGASCFAPVVLRRLFQEAKAPLVRRSRHWHPDDQGNQAPGELSYPISAKSRFCQAEGMVNCDILPVPVHQPLEGSLPERNDKMRMVPFASVPEAKSG